MATQRLTMRQTREILRQKWLLGRSHRQIAQSLGVSLGTVGMMALRARAAGLSWPEVQSLPETELETRLYGLPRPPQAARPLPDGTWIHTELRKPGVTLQLLHLEYLEQHPAGYRYTQFCEYHHRWLNRQGVVLRQIHRAARKCLSINFMAGIKGRSFTVAELEEAGVRRVSLATSLYRAAMTGLLDAAREVKEKGTFGFLSQAVATSELIALMRA